MWKTRSGRWVIRSDAGWQQAIKGCARNDRQIRRDLVDGGDRVLRGTRSAGVRLEVAAEIANWILFSRVAEVNS